MPTSEPPAAGEPWSRRRFVKTAVLSAAAGAAAATGAFTLTSLARPSKRPPSFRYFGVKVLLGSKAPQGIPIIPVRVNPAGELVGQPDHLEWYRYCGRANAPGTREDFATDNTFRFHVAPDALAATKSEGIDAWYEPKLGQKAILSDFDEVGKGAPVLWRSEGQERENPLTCLLMRVDPSTHDPTTAQRFFPDGILAVFAACAHLCLVPTWRASRKGYGDGHWDDITCFGHGSWYSPREIAQYSFPPEG